MGVTLDYFFCCLDLKLGSIIMAWWGMIFSGIAIITGIIAALTDKQFNSHFPIHFHIGNGIVSLIIVLIIMCAYFYFSYQLLLGAQSGDNHQMIGYLILHGICVALWVWAAITSTAGIFIMAILYVYLWFCVYSFYVKCGGRGIA